MVYQGPQVMVWLTDLTLRQMTYCTYVVPVNGAEWPPHRLGLRLTTPIIATHHHSLTLGVSVIIPIHPSHYSTTAVSFRVLNTTGN